MLALSPLNYQFNQADLLQQALTHRSFSSEHNERLEFLGDSLLNLYIANALYRQFPQAKEGELSRFRAQLVKGTTLAEIAKELQLGESIRLGSGEKKSGGQQRASILADAVEAIIGAIYLDSSFETCESVVLQWYRARLDAIDITRSAKDPKSTLQELLQARHLDLPVYKVIDAQGQAHEQLFTVQCELKSLGMKTVAEGKSRKIAEQKAASELVVSLENEK